MSQIVGKKLDGHSDIVRAARELQNAGAQNVLVSMGADGAILQDQAGIVTKASAFKINAVNTVGAGDSMVAGFIYGTLHGYGEKLLSFASACGAATAANMGIAQRNDVKRFIEF